MAPTTRLSEIDPANPTYLLVSSNEAEPRVVPLTVGASVFVGSGPNCKIQVSDNSVQQLHCMLLLQHNNVLMVQDWNTGATFLNESSVSEETEVQSGDVITIGSCRLTAVLGSEFHHGIGAELLRGDDLDNADDLACEVDLKNDPVGEVDDEFSFNVGADPESSGDEVTDSGFKYDFDADLKENSGANHSTFDSLPNDIGFAFESGGHDDGGSMSIEVEQLRFEIADRDAQILALRQQVASSDQSTTVDESDTVKLVARLEDLLDELKTSDERVQGLEELLRVAEQATAAERDERSQVEKWLTEIEKRVGQREAESQAEIEGLSRQLKHAKQDAGMIQSQLESVSAVRTGSEKQDDAVAVLNKQVEVLRTSLQEANEKIQELLERPVMSGEEIDYHAKMLEAQDELARFRLDVSKERAEMARRHAELESIRDELEMRVNRPSRESDDSDSRIRAMREHLKDIHAQEKAAQAEQKSSSLGGRIANLLTRLR